MEPLIQYSDTFDRSAAELWPIAIIAIGQECGRTGQPVIEDDRVLIPSTEAVEWTAVGSQTIVTVTKPFVGCIVDGQEPPRPLDPAKFAARLFERIHATAGA